ncbi:hypothetical protein [Jejubacter calystegiae]|uniref:hypothetical protein n=1 Tax=Jejubacter calystegiae TaxID=2579935 RepID=UPI00143DDA3C|nr:hypothetical protein [Jejubacter calystegiae]
MSLSHLPGLIRPAAAQLRAAPLPEPCPDWTIVDVVHSLSGYVAWSKSLRQRLPEVLHA